MKKAEPIFDPTTSYRIKVRDRVDVEWLQSLDSSAEIIIEQTGQLEDITVIRMHTDQAGFVGLLRSLHGLGMTILQFEIIPRKEE
jgi:hypothetical protein